MRDHVADQHQTTPPTGRNWLSRRAILISVTVVVAFVIAVIVVHVVAGDDGFNVLDGESGNLTYFAIFALIFGDAICALLPGETTLNTGAVLAANGTLELGLVMLAGALGAIAGDSALYWIARKGRGRFKTQIENARNNTRVAAALGFLGSSAPLLLIAGRYVPGLRFAINATMGLSAYPYRRFLLWSAIGGTVWAIYTSGLAYLVAVALEGYPLASIIISGAITSIALCAIFIVARRRKSAQPALSEAGPSLSTNG